MFQYVANFIYDGDALAERRARALTIDHKAGELMGEAALRSLPDEESVLEVEDQLHEELTRLVMKTASNECCWSWAITLEAHPAWRHHRDWGLIFGFSAAIESLASSLEQELFAAAEDGTCLRMVWSGHTCWGSAGLQEPVARPLRDLVRRFARTHGLFKATAIGDRFGLPAGIVREQLQLLEQRGTSGALPRWRVLSGVIRRCCASSARPSPIARTS